MSRKMLVTLELEVVDLSDEDRKECADGMGIDESDEEFLEDMPFVADLSEGDLRAAVHTFFEGASIPECQSEIWAGSDYYCNVTNILLKDARLLDPVVPMRGVL